MASEVAILVGQKPVANYVLAAVTQFTLGSKRVTLKARGRAISKAVDAAEVVRRFMGEKVDIASVKITSEKVGELEKERIVSAIEIILEMKRSESILIGEVSIKAHGRTLEEFMLRIPHTYEVLHYEKPEAYFYYFTDENYRREDSKYRLLDETLTIFGSFRRNVKVITIVREGVPSGLWNAIMKGLELDSYPALVVSSESLGIEKLAIDTNEYKPPTRKIARWKSGFINDLHLQDKDTLRKLLNELHDAAREGISLETLMRKKTIEEVLKKAGVEIKNLIIEIS
jgi:DNA-binding protein